MRHLSARTRLAGPVDLDTYGPYDPGRPPRIRFRGRVTADGDFTARPFRYHVYGGLFCPYSHRVAIVRELAGLTDMVTMSYVDDARDGRGWAFREKHGPDPVNGYRLLREAYEATEEGYDGHVSVPALWDRFGSRVAGNDPDSIEIDLATRFAHLASRPSDLYPVALRERIDDLHARLDPALSGSAGRTEQLDAFEQLDARLHRATHLVGDELTLADIRVWVRLVRYDVGPNATRAINPGLHVFPHLWSYARALYTQPAFRVTTDFESFTAPGARMPEWTVD